MVWEYLTTFWSKIVAIAEYPVIFFENIGNAVAGGIGSFLDTTVHLGTDLGVIFNWLFVELRQVFLALLTPFTYIFTVIKAIIASAFTPVTNELSYNFSSGVLEVFSAIPNWAIFGTVLGAMVLLFLGLSLIKSVGKVL
jgi:hypothetical protein